VIIRICTPVTAGLRGA